ncbi:flagellar hook protein FlgL [Tateyamaria omphalii]|uniref:flagellin N-terminal helical domain-containing protein n=1 Tax=Tateyamaria omphalii TaxID=299262 RepID=UPI00167BB290|nr:flagellin [Tateyamaria omphalii]GGX38264.1 flagellar hook protein FlgL [Tateyamaria omphalii]
MSSYGLGDLAQTFLLQRRGAAIKADMARLAEELQTGQVSDTKSVLAGNVAYLSGIENDLRGLSAFKVAGSEAAQFASSVQSALDRMDAGVGLLSTDLLTVSASASGPVLDQMSTAAETEFKSLVSALNTSSAGRSLFAGAATDSRALNDAEVVLADLRAAITGNSSLTDIEAAIDQWFDDPAGFSTSAYTGSGVSILPFQLAENEQVAVDLKADDQVFRDLFKGVALATVAADGALGLSADNQRDLLERAGTKILESKESLTATQSRVGAAEARIETIAARNAARDTSLQLAKGALLQADPFDTATQLEAVQFQLQSLYTISARMSDLTLVNFIR